MKKAGCWYCGSKDGIKVKSKDGDYIKCFPCGARNIKKDMDVNGVMSE